MNTTLLDPKDEDVLEEPAVKTCQQGQRFGYPTLTSLNITSKIYVGVPFNISWKFTELVTKRPDTMTIKLQQLAERVSVTWDAILAENVSTTVDWWIWHPKNHLDGKYKIRLVPNGKETFIPPSQQMTRKQPCFEDGEAVPFVSTTFRLINPKETLEGDVGGHLFGPSNGSLRATGSLFGFIYLCLILLWKKVS